ncbi:MAG TPA: hypothetical protein VL135_14400 [Terracidiphilus sp.]|nr:hypothetical protein [Terracidiphilus sp.]
MYRKTTLYIDIDDTIIAEVIPGSGRDLRPCVITHLTVLGQLYDCCWLTSWPYSPADAPPSGMSVQTLMRALYAHGINETFRYAHWDREHPDGKAGFILDSHQPHDWYWLEDPIPLGEHSALTSAWQTRSLYPRCPARPLGIPRCHQRSFPAHWHHTTLF